MLSGSAEWRHRIDTIAFIVFLSFQNFLDTATFQFVLLFLLKLSLFFLQSFYALFVLKDIGFQGIYRYQVLIGKFLVRKGTDAFDFDPLLDAFSIVNVPVLANDRVLNQLVRDGTVERPHFEVSPQTPILPLGSTQLITFFMIYI